MRSLTIARIPPPRNGGLSSRDELLGCLSALPGEIEDAEDALLRALSRLEEARSVLAERRAALVLDPEAVTGRNEQQREAQLLELTRLERHAVALAEAERDRARLRLNRRQHEFAAARSAARLLAGLKG